MTGEERDLFALEALPYGAIVLDGRNCPWQKARFENEKQFPGLETVWLMFGSSTVRSTGKILPFGPFRVVHNGPAQVRRSMLGMTVEA